MKGHLIKLAYKRAVVRGVIDTDVVSDLLLNWKVKAKHRSCLFFFSIQDKKYIW